MGSRNIILDIGEGYTKVGFAGEPYPRHIFPTENFGASKKLSLSGQKERHPLSLWQEYITPFIKNIYFNRLLKNPQDQLIVVCENPFWPYVFKEALVKALFQLEVPGIVFLSSWTLPVCITGQEDGLVIDVGFAESRATPVCAGFAEQSALCTIPVGMLQIRQQFLEQLKSVGVSMTESKESGSGGAKYFLNTSELTPAILDSLILRSLFFQPFSQTKSYSKNDSKNEVKSGDVKSEEKKPIKSAAQLEIEKKAIDTLEAVKYVIGNNYGESVEDVLVISPMIRRSVCEVLFGENDYEASIAEMICQCLLKCGLDNRAAVIQNVVVSGGVSLLPGFLPRLHDEINHLIATQSKYASLGALRNKLRFAASSFPRNLLTWIGGSVMGSLEQDVFTRENYQDSQKPPDWLMKRELRAEVKKEMVEGSDGGRWQKEGGKWKWEIIDDGQQRIRWSELKDSKAVTRSPEESLGSPSPSVAPSASVSGDGAGAGRGSSAAAPAAPATPPESSSAPSASPS